MQIVHKEYRDPRVYRLRYFQKKFTHCMIQPILVQFFTMQDTQDAFGRKKFSQFRWCLIGCLIVIVLFAAGAVFTPDWLTDAVRWVANSDSARELRAPSRQEAVPEERLIEMMVDSIGLIQVSYQPVVILKQLEGDISLPILIGPAEVTAIAVILEGIDMPRPLTADLLYSVIDSMGANVNYIVINDIRDQIFYADVVLNADWQQLIIDARPSDAIAVALRAGAPIYATEAVLNKAGILPEPVIDGHTVRYF